MHNVLYSNLIHLTAWKIIGYLGVVIFASRWVVQLLASKKAGRPVVTRFFWVLSLIGSALLLSYFVFGKNDSVGVLSNLFPSFIAVYNLYLELTHAKRTSIQAEMNEEFVDNMQRTSSN